MLAPAVKSVKKMLFIGAHAETLDHSVKLGGPSARIGCYAALVLSRAEVP
jgi:hypothetical protein